MSGSKALHSGPDHRGRRTAPVAAVRRELAGRDTGPLWPVSTRRNAATPDARVPRARRSMSAPAVIDLCCRPAVRLAWQTTGNVTTWPCIRARLSRSAGFANGLYLGAGQDRIPRFHGRAVAAGLVEDALAIPANRRRWRTRTRGHAKRPSSGPVGDARKRRGSDLRWRSAPRGRLAEIHGPE